MYPNILGPYSSATNHVPSPFRNLILSLALGACLHGQSTTPGKRRFATLCAACHGADGTGGERGPALVGREESRVHSVEDIRNAIRNGFPAAGMPPFHLQPNQLEDLVAYVHALRSPAADSPAPGDAAEGERFFFGKGDCASCHTVRGRGGWTGPDLSDLGRRRSLTEIESALKEPGRRVTPGFAVVTAHLRNGESIHGLLKNESTFDVQLIGLDGRVHLLARDEISTIDRSKESLMPAVAADAPEYPNLLAYLSRLSGGTVDAGASVPPPLPGAV